MPASYPTAWKAVQSQTEPRFLLASGTESRLRDRLVASATERENVELHEVSGAADVWTPLFTYPDKQSKTKVVLIHDAHLVTSWKPLKQWLDKCKPIRCVAETTVMDVARVTDPVTNTRGMTVDCSAPDTEAKRRKLVLLFVEWFEFSQTKITLLLNKVDWNVSAALDVMEKARLLNLDISSDVVYSLGFTVDNCAKYEYYLQQRKKLDAVQYSKKLADSEIPGMFTRLERWLELIARLRSEQTAYKTPREIAYKIDTDVKTVQQNLSLSKKYDVNAINSASIALANASRDWQNGYRAGVVDVLTVRW